MQHICTVGKCPTIKGLSHDLKAAGHAVVTQIQLGITRLGSGGLPATGMLAQPVMVAPVERFAIALPVGPGPLHPVWFAMRHATLFSALLKAARDGPKNAMRHQARIRRGLCAAISA